MLKFLWYNFFPIPCCVSKTSRLWGSKGLGCSFPSQLVCIQNANPPGYFQGEYPFHDEAGVTYSSVATTSVFMAS